MTSERRGQLELTIVVAEVMAARPAKTRTVSFMAVIILRFLVAKGIGIMIHIYSIAKYQHRFIYAH